jgi:UDP-N-acetylglucosamine diphosphorylase/glucosamine-1-phosphate N-acetyltransferase
MTADPLLILRGNGSPLSFMMIKETFMRIVIFEDSTHDNFYPLSLTRPLWDLRMGLFTFAERIARIASRDCPGAQIAYSGRDELAALCRGLDSSVLYNEALFDDDILFVNALFAPVSLSLESGTAFVSGGRLAAARTMKVTAPMDRLHDAAWARSAGLNITELPQDAVLIDHVWQIPLVNGTMINTDFPLLEARGNSQPQIGVTFLGEQGHIHIGSGVTIDPCVVIDARRGCVVIDDGVQIDPFTRIEGPCAIGKNCVVLGAKLREGCSFGPSCRIGGEVEEAVFQAHSNKYHDGFIGHAYIGEWVNLGALTTNSDLKNDYSSVSVYRPGGIADTGETKVGCLIGDFVKTSIGTLINTGSVLGTGSMAVMSGRMTPPHLPPFCRYIKNGMRDPGGADAVIATAGIACSRRKKVLPQAMEILLREIYRSGSSVRKDEMEKWNAALK